MKNITEHEAETKIASFMRGALVRKKISLKSDIKTIVDNIINEIETKQEQKMIDLSPKGNNSNKIPFVHKNKTPNKEIVKLNNANKNTLWQYIKPTKPIHIVLYIGIITFALTKVFQIAAVKAFCAKSAITTLAALKYAAMAIASLFSKVTLASALPYIIVASWLATIILLIVILNKYSSNDEALEVPANNNNGTAKRSNSEELLKGNDNNRTQTLHVVFKKRNENLVLGRNRKPQRTKTENEDVSPKNV